MYGKFFFLLMFQQEHREEMDKNKLNESSLKNRAEAKQEQILSPPFDATRWQPVWQPDSGYS